jgi:arylsulfatase A-like enzyme
VLLLAGSVTVPTRAASPYNFVVIVTDDLSERMLDDLLAADLMPNFRTEFVDTGMRFTNSFVTSPLCCPSRATLLTGQYAHNHKVRSNFLPKGGVTLLDDSSTLATWMASAGYTTGLVGKYLNGYGKNASSLPSDNPTYVPPGWTDWQALMEPTIGHVYDYRLNDNGVLINYGSAPEDYQTDVLASRAVAFLNELPGEAATIDVPFFLWIATPAPHDESTSEHCALPNQALGTIRPAPRHVGLAAGIPLPQSPSFNEADTSDKPAWLRDQFPLLYDQAAIDCVESSYRGRLESMLAVDDLIGAVTDVLRTRNALERTVLIFTSDNGYLLGEHRATGKIVPYQESARVPLFIRHPAMTSASAMPSVVLNTDVAPTIVELAAATPTRVVDGRSLVPLLAGPSPTTWERDLFLLEGSRISQDGLTVPSYSALRSGPFAPYPNRAMTLWEDGSAEYYELDLDPFELQNAISTQTPAALTWARTRGRQLSLCAGQRCRDLETF